MKSFKWLLAISVAISVLLFSPEIFMVVKSSLRKTIGDNLHDIHRLEKNLDATGEHSSTGDRNLRLANGYNIFAIENKDSNMKTETQNRIMDRKGTNVFLHEVVVQEKSAMNGKNKQGSAVNNASLENEFQFVSSTQIEDVKRNNVPQTTWTSSDSIGGSQHYVERPSYTPHLVPDDTTMREKAQHTPTPSSLPLKDQTIAQTTSLKNCPLCRETGEECCGTCIDKGKKENRGCFLPKQCPICSVTGKQCCGTCIDTGKKQSRGCLLPSAEPSLVASSSPSKVFWVEPSMAPSESPSVAGSLVPSTEPSITENLSDVPSPIVEPISSPSTEPSIPKQCDICSVTNEECCGTCVKTGKDKGCLECTGSIVDVQYDDGTSDQFLTCETPSGKNYKVKNVDEGFVCDHFGQGKYISGDVDLTFDEEDIIINGTTVEIISNSTPGIKKKKKCNNDNNGNGNGNGKNGNGKNGNDNGNEKNGNGNGNNGNGNENGKNGNGNENGKNGRNGNNGNGNGNGNSKTCDAIIDEPTTLINSTPGLRGRRLQTQVVGNCGTYVGGSCAGTRTVLVVRVEAADKNTTADESQLAESIFENPNDSLNLQSWYKQCSYNQLNFVPATGVGINGGVTTVTVTSSSTDGDSVMNNDIAAALNTQFNVTSPNQIADHVMYCLPPGTMNGIAYANVNNWRSVYSDNWCTYVSAQAHEIGHNLMLAHSGDPAGTGSQATYGDKSGMMGFSYSNDDGPIQCFNASKNWQLGWYDDKRVPVSYDGWEGNLIGLSDYGNSNVAAGDMVIARVNLNESYYVSFNRKTGINSGTQEGGDQVMVHKRELGTEYAASDVLAYLNSGDAYTSPDSNFTVTVNSIDLTSNPARANVKIERFDTPPPCYTGTVTVVINPDPYPGETSWDITDDAENVLASGGSTGASNIVLGDGYYTFSIYDSYGDGICCQFGSGSYTLQVGSTFEVTGGEFDSIESTTFGICNNVSPTAAPTNAPTVAPTKSPTPNPTVSPTNLPSMTSSMSPSILPSSGPSLIESASPSTLPSSYPSSAPSAVPSSVPSMIFSSVPSVLQSESPSVKASAEPSLDASSSPSEVLSAEPSLAPSDSPSVALTLVPSAKPTVAADPAPCFDGTVTVSITQDNYPSETSWDIQDYANHVVASGGSTGQQNINLANGFYTFTIYDSYGDGICCGYGNGSYTLQVGGTTVKTGGEFANQEITEFGICSFQIFSYSSSPSILPSSVPSLAESARPSSLPSVEASESPSLVASSSPSMVPSDLPSVAVSLVPSAEPSVLPSLSPSLLPSSVPSLAESARPSSLPSSYPSLGQSAVPSFTPSMIFSSVPSVLYSDLPSVEASESPSLVASSSPSMVPSDLPSVAASLVPSAEPSILPSLSPSLLPSSVPSLVESGTPSSLTSVVISESPSLVASLNLPTEMKSEEPSLYPSNHPSSSPSLLRSDEPNLMPLNLPTNMRSDEPSLMLSSRPSSSPSVLRSDGPSSFPSVLPTETRSDEPSVFLSNQPSAFPSDLPSIKFSSTPSVEASIIPSIVRSDGPSLMPSNRPSSSPSVMKSDEPSLLPSNLPTEMKSEEPSLLPSNHPSSSPSLLRSDGPSLMPSNLPTKMRSDEPSLMLSNRPSSSPSVLRSDGPSSFPSVLPTEMRSDEPNKISISVDNDDDEKSWDEKTAPTIAPTSAVIITTHAPISSRQKTSRPTNQASLVPSLAFTSSPTKSRFHILRRTPSPTDLPSATPTSSPTTSPTKSPTSSPTSNPTSSPTSAPSKAPTPAPSPGPTRFPTSAPTTAPTSGPVAPAPTSNKTPPTVMPSPPKLIANVPSKLPPVPKPVSKPVAPPKKSVKSNKSSKNPPPVPKPVAPKPVPKPVAPKPIPKPVPKPPPPPTPPPKKAPPPKSVKSNNSSKKSPAPPKKPPPPKSTPPKKPPPKKLPPKKPPPKSTPPKKPPPKSTPPKKPSPKKPPPKKPPPKSTPPQKPSPKKPPPKSTPPKKPPPKKPPPKKPPPPPEKSPNKRSKRERKSRSNKNKNKGKDEKKS